MARLQCGLQNKLPLHTMNNPSCKRHRICNVRTKARHLASASLWTCGNLNKQNHMQKCTSLACRRQHTTRIRPMGHHSMQSLPQDNAMLQRLQDCNHTDSLHPQSTETIQRMQTLNRAVISVHSGRQSLGICPTAALNCTHAVQANHVQALQAACRDAEPIASVALSTTHGLLSC